MQAGKKIAVAGATGRVGCHVVDVLRASGYDVVAMSRSSGVDVITGDGLTAALDGAEAIIDVATGPSPDQQAATEFFADEGPPMTALLGRLIAAQRAGQAAAEVPLGFLVRLQRAFDTRSVSADPGKGVPAAMPGLVEPLTSRELEVLEMLTAGRPNQAIAQELVVTLDTVKKQVGHVLAKLGAANRTEAVARARELGLIR